MDKPVVALTMGDAAGIGPEILIKVLAERASRELCRPLVVGDAQVIARACRLVGAGLEVRVVTSVAEARFTPEAVEVLCPPGLTLGPYELGKVDPALGRAAGLCLAQAAELAMAGLVQGIVSAPLNKQAFHLAGYHYRDELQYLGDLTHSAEPYILGAVSPTLWTVAVTEHVAFAAIPALLTRTRLLRYMHHLHHALARVGFERPRLAVAALNPHAGDGGLAGREEIEQITPAVEEARREGLDVAGPVPADTVFVRAREGEFEGVVCMYHDQANIARKLLATRRGATLFMGLPVVVGTTAHGTAFDKAGRGVAEPCSLADALRYVSLLAAR